MRKKKSESAPPAEVVMRPPWTTPGPATIAQPDPDDVQALVNRLSTGDREDFVKMLANWTQCAPGTDPATIPALKALAQRFPDRYMQGMTMVARIAGMMGEHDGARGGTTIITFIQQMASLSDAEIYRRARENAMAVMRLNPTGGSGTAVSSSTVVARTPVQLRQPPPPSEVIDVEKS